VGKEENRKSDSSFARSFPNYVRLPVAFHSEAEKEIIIVCGQKNIIMEFIWWFGGNSVSLQQSFTNDHEQNNSTTDHALPDGDTAHAGC
jgi:hypothetical protein